VDDVKVGSIVRAVRIRRGLRQSEVAAAAGVSDSTVSLIESGGLEGVSVRALRRVAVSVGVSLQFAPRWRGADLAKLLDERHAHLVRTVASRLGTLGWQIRPECTFSMRGERGSIDVLAWHPRRRAVLVIEVKTDLVDLQDLLSTMDRKRRLAPHLAGELGWQPAVVGLVLVVLDETWARNSVSSYAPVFDTALPARTIEVRKWLVEPDRDLRGIWFLPNSDSGGIVRRRGGTFRVRKRVRAHQGALAGLDALDSPRRATISG
jgi:transcriptional regulator with XRE-family HTH domain